MKLIGITSSSIEARSCVNKAYTEAFTRPGFVPVMLPQFPIANREVLTQAQYNEQHAAHISELVSRLDGLCLAGGPDINPMTYGEPIWGAQGCNAERDFMEIALFDAFIAAEKPIIGICRGHQLSAIRLGLSNFMQDLAATKEIHQASDRDMKDRQEAVHIAYIMGAFRDYMREKTHRPDLNTLTLNSHHHEGLVLHPSCERPKSIKTGEQYSQWLASAIHSYQHENDVSILACTGMVIEGYERASAKLVCWQHHPECFGPDGLAIQYFLDRYMSDETAE